MASRSASETLAELRNALASAMALPYVVLQADIALDPDTEEAVEEALASDERVHELLDRLAAELITLEERSQPPSP